MMLYTMGVKKTATIMKQAAQFTKFVAMLSKKASKSSEYQSYFDFLNDAIARNPEIGAQDSRLKSRNSQGFRKNSDILATLGKCEQNIKTACNSSFAGGSMTEQVNRCKTIAINADETLQGFATCFSRNKDPSSLCSCISELALNETEIFERCDIKKSHAQVKDQKDACKGNISICKVNALATVGAVTGCQAKVTETFEDGTTTPGVVIPGVQ